LAYLEQSETLLQRIQLTDEVGMHVGRPFDDVHQGLEQRSNCSRQLLHLLESSLHLPVDHSGDGTVKRGADPSLRRGRYPLWTQWRETLKNFQPLVKFGEVRNHPMLGDPPEVRIQIRFESGRVFATATSLVDQFANPIGGVGDIGRRGVTHRVDRTGAP
jgi:hypothetical protein